MRRKVVGDDSDDDEDFSPAEQLVRRGRRAEAELRAATAGEQAIVSLDLPLGLTLNPDGSVSRVTAGGQAEERGVLPGLRLLSAGGVAIHTLGDLKAAILLRKQQVKIATGT